jgi:hypothetical protein
MFDLRKVLLVISLSGLMLGCSDEEGKPAPSAEATQTDASGSMASAVDEEEDFGAPEISEVRLKPELPESGKVIRAIVRLVHPTQRAEVDYEWVVDGNTDFPNAPAIELPELESGARVSVQVVARNDDGESASELAYGIVPDALPKITKLEVLEVDLEDGSKGWRAVVEAEDESGDSADLRFVWYVNDRMTSQRQSEFSTSDLKRGDQVFVEVVARIGSSESRPLRSGTLGIANSAPEIKSIPSGLTNEGTFRYRIKVEDPDGDLDLRFALETGPPGMQMNPDGELRWDPQVDQAGDHKVMFSVTDNQGGKATQEFVLPVRVSTAAPGEDPAAID